MSEHDDNPDWFTEMDIEILELLGSELVLSPSIIAENIDRSREGISNRLSALQAGGLVEKVDRGKYKITPEGLEVVPGEWVYIRTFDDPGDREYAIKMNDADKIEPPVTPGDLEDLLDGKKVYVRREPEDDEDSSQKDN